MCEFEWPKESFISLISILNKFISIFQAIEIHKPLGSCLSLAFESSSFLQLLSSSILSPASSILVYRPKNHYSKIFATSFLTHIFLFSLPSPPSLFPMKVIALCKFTHKILTHSTTS